MKSDFFRVSTGANFLDICQLLSTPMCLETSVVYAAQIVPRCEFSSRTHVVLPTYLRVIMFLFRFKTRESMTNRELLLGESAQRLVSRLPEALSPHQTLRIRQTMRFRIIRRYSPQSSTRSCGIFHFNASAKLSRHFFKKYIKSVRSIFKTCVRLIHPAEVLCVVASSVRITCNGNAIALLTHSHTRAPYPS